MSEEDDRPDGADLSGAQEIRLLAVTSEPRGRSG